MDVVVVVAGFAILSLLLAGGTFLLARRAGRQLLTLEPGWQAEEARTGRCAACGGLGTRAEVHAARASATERLHTCFRCHGTGSPPTTC
jgi:hypothetical protein